MKKGLAVILFLIVVIFIGLGVLVKWNSSDILESFGTMDAKIEEANKATEARNDSFLRSLESKNVNSMLPSARQLDTLATSLTEYLDSLKKEMLGGISDGDYENMGQSARVDALLFEGDSLSAKGVEFKTMLDYFRINASEIVADESPELADEIRQIFSTEAETNRQGTEVAWMDYHFKGFPLVATITRISQLQSEITTTKQQYLEILLTSQ